MLSHIVHEQFKGVNKGLPDSDIGDDELSDGRNMVVTEDGVVTRPGTEVVSTLDVKSIYRFYQNSLDRKITVSTGGANIYHDGVAAYTACTPDKEFQFENYHDILYMVNGEDGLLKDDGTIITDVTGTVLADYKLCDVTQNAECLYVTDGDIVWESDLGNPDSFDGNSFKRIPVENGAKVRRIKKHQSGNLVAYTDNDAFVFRFSYTDTTGPIASNTYSLDSIGTGNGLIAPKTLINVDGDHVGLSANGLFMFNGSSMELFPNWYKVKPYFDTADPENLVNSVAVLWKRWIILSFPSYGSSINDQHIVFDLEKGNYFPLWTGYSAIAYAPYMGAGDTKELYFTDGSDICKFNSSIYTDKDVLIDAYVVTKAFNYGDKAAQDKFKKAKVILNSGSGTVNFSYMIDNSSWSTVQALSASSSLVWGVANDWATTLKWGTGLGDKELKATLTGSGAIRKGKYIKYKVSKSGQFGLKSIVAFFRPKKAR